MYLWCRASNKSGTFWKTQLPFSLTCHQPTAENLVFQGTGANSGLVPCRIIGFSAKRWRHFWNTVRSLLQFSHTCAHRSVSQLSWRPNRECHRQKERHYADIARKLKHSLVQADKNDKEIGKIGKLWDNLYLAPHTWDGSKRVSRWWLSGRVLLGVWMKQFRCLLLCQFFRAFGWFPDWFGFTS